MAFGKLQTRDLNNDFVLPVEKGGTGAATVEEALTNLGATDIAHESTLQEVDNNVSGIKTDVANVKTDINGVKTDVNTMNTNVTSMKSKIDAINTLITNMSNNVTSKYRADDYLIQTVTVDTTVCTTAISGIGCSYTVLANLPAIPADTFKINITCSNITSTGTMGIMPYFSIGLDTTYEGSLSIGAHSSYIEPGTTATYNKTLTNFSIGSGQLSGKSVVLRTSASYAGSSASKCSMTIQNVRVRYYGFKRVVTSTLYEANTLKSYGQVSKQQFNPAPRLDRFEYVSSHYYPLAIYDASNIRTVNGIPYLVNISEEYVIDYKVYY